MKTRKLALSLMSAGTIVALTTVTGFAAGSGYTPGTAVGTSEAGGGTLSVVTSQTVSATGGTLQATSGANTIDLTVPSGTFAQDQQITVSTGDASTIASTPQGTTAVGDYDISFTGTPAQSMTLAIKNPTFDGNAEVYKATTSGLVKVNATAKAGEVDISFSTDPEFVIVEPKNLSGATTAKTGFEPDIWIASGVLLAIMGAFALRKARRKA